MTNKVLITGIAGLFGSNISRYLLMKNYIVVGVDNFSGGYRENIADGIILYDVDIRDYNLFNQIVKEEKPDYILHFAAYAAEGLSHYIRNHNYSNNLVATSNVINAAINYDVKKIIFTSSMAVYGEKYNPPFTEQMIPMPIDPYGIAKYASELDLLQAKEHFGLDYSIIRPHNVIGKYQNIWDKYRNVIGIWIRQMLDGQPLTIYGDGLQKRAFSDIFYYCEPIEKLLYDFGGEIYNLGSDYNITIKEAMNIFRKCALDFGYNTKVVFLEERREAKYAYSSQEKAKSMLGFNDNTNLEKIISEMIEWAINQPKRTVKKMKYEIYKNIYSYWEEEL